MKSNKKNLIKWTTLGSTISLPLLSISCNAEEVKNLVNNQKQKIDNKENTAVYIKNSFMENIKTTISRDAFYIKNAENFKQEILNIVDEKLSKDTKFIKQIDNFIDNYQEIFSDEKLLKENKVIFYFNYLSGPKDKKSISPLNLIGLEKKALDSVYVSKREININYLKSEWKKSKTKFEKYFIFIKKTDMPNPRDIKIRIEALEDYEYKKYNSYNPENKIVIFEPKIAPWTENREDLKEIKIKNIIPYSSEQDSIYGGSLNLGNNFAYVEYILENMENISFENLSEKQKELIIKAEIEKYSSKYDSLKITSVKELKRIYPETIFPNYEFLKKYNDEFFQNNILIVNRFLHTWSGILLNDYEYPKIQKVYVSQKEKELIIEFVPPQYYSPKIGSTAIDYRSPGFLIEIPKSELNNLNINEIKLKWINTDTQKEIKVPYYK